LGVAFNMDDRVALCRGVNSSSHYWCEQNK